MTTYRKYSSWGGKTMETERLHRMLQPMTIHCHCGQVFMGQAGTVLDLAAAHRRTHPGMERKADVQRKLLRQHRGKVSRG